MRPFDCLENADAPNLVASRAGVVSGRRTCQWIEVNDADDNSETSRRSGNEGIEASPCVGPDACKFADGECKAYARFKVLIGDGEDDALGSFVLHTTSFNTIRTLAARLKYFSAVSAGRLACMPWTSSCVVSPRRCHRSAICYVDLMVRAGLTMEQAIEEARERDDRRRDNGFDQAALDEAARQGFANGAFEEREEDVRAVAEEFYPPTGETGVEHGRPKDAPASLRGRLQEKVARVGGA